MRCCDGKLSPVDLNTEGNRFAEAYYRMRNYAED